MPPGTLMNHPSIRHRASALVAVLLLAAPLAQAQAVRLLNAFPPGGPSDIISRAVAERMVASLGKPVVVDDKAGAGGNLAAADVAKGPADGTVILTSIDTTFTVNPHVYDKLPFAPKDLKPLMVMASSGLLVGTHPSVGVKTLGELVAKGKAAPLTFSSGSNGSPGHLAAAILTDATGAQVTHVPYKGNSPAVMANLRKVLADALDQPDVRAQLAKLDMVYEGLQGDDAARRISSQGERFARIIKATGMKIE
jgi:tripartite-type tricarboxylate transporter receptor subunit TctC